MWPRITACLALACAVACGPPAGARQKSPLVIAATSGPGGGMYTLASALRRAYSKDLTGYDSEVDPVVTSSASVDALERGSAQVGFAQADIAYLAYRRGTTTDPKAHKNLRGVAVLWANVAQVAVSTMSPIHSIADLRGRRLNVGMPGSSTEMLARIILTAYGLRYADLLPTFDFFSRLAVPFQNGQINAALITTALPSPVLRDVSRRYSIRLLPIDPDRVAPLRGNYPFLRPVVIPAGTYVGQQHAVPSIGIDELLLCEKDLDEDVVYQLTKTFFETLPAVAWANAAGAALDLERAPGTPIPLHPGAARYYREREISR